MPRTLFKVIFPPPPILRRNDIPLKFGSKVWREHNKKQLLSPNLVTSADSAHPLPTREWTPYVSQAPCPLLKIVLDMTETRVGHLFVCLHRIFEPLVRSARKPVKRDLNQSRRILCALHCKIHQLRQWLFGQIILKSPLALWDRQTFSAPEPGFFFTDFTARRTREDKKAPTLTRD